MSKLPASDLGVFLAETQSGELPAQEVLFNYNDRIDINSILKPLIGKSGWLTLACYTFRSLDQSEDHLIFGAVTDDGELLDEVCAARLFTQSGKVKGPCLSIPPSAVSEVIDQRLTVIQRAITERNASLFEAEAEKLEGWADELELSLELEINEMNSQIKVARRSVTAALTFEEKLVGQMQIKALESQRDETRRSLFEALDKVNKQRDELISKIKGKLTQSAYLKRVFTIHWRLE